MSEHTCPFCGGPDISRIDFVNKEHRKMEIAANTCNDCNRLWLAENRGVVAKSMEADQRVKDFIFGTRELLRESIASYKARSNAFDRLWDDLDSENIFPEVQQLMVRLLNEEEATDEN